MRALTLLAHQETQPRNVIYQNRLALDYLLAAGDVFWKFNLINCCVQIDNQCRAVKDLVKQMTGLAHVHVHTWHGWDTNYLFRGWFSTFGGFKTLIRVVHLLLSICLLLRLACCLLFRQLPPL